MSKRKATTATELLKSGLHGDVVVHTSDGHQHRIYRWLLSNCSPALAAGVTADHTLQLDQPSAVLLPILEWMVDMQCGEYKNWSHICAAVQFCHDYKLQLETTIINDAVNRVELYTDWIDLYKVAAELIHQPLCRRIYCAVVKRLANIQFATANKAWLCPDTAGGTAKVCCMHSPAGPIPHAALHISRCRSASRCCHHRPHIPVDLLESHRARATAFRDMLLAAPQQVQRDILDSLLQLGCC